MATLQLPIKTIVMYHNTLLAWYSEVFEHAAHPKMWSVRGHNVLFAVVDMLRLMRLGPLAHDATKRCTTLQALLSQPLLPKGYTHPQLMAALLDAGLPDKFMLLPAQLLTVHCLHLQRLLHVRWKWTTADLPTSAVLFAKPGAGKTLMATAYSLTAFNPTFQGNFPLARPETTLPDGEYLGIFIRGLLFLLDREGGIRAGPEVHADPAAVPKPRWKRSRSVLDNNGILPSLKPPAAFPADLGLSYSTSSDCILSAAAQQAFFLRDAIDTVHTTAEGENYIAAKTLIVCPTSVIPNWVAKLKSYQPDAQIVSHITASDVTMTLASRISTFARADYVVTTPHLLMGSTAFFPQPGGIGSGGRVISRDFDPTLTPALTGEPGSLVPVASLRPGHRVLYNPMGLGSMSDIFWVVQTTPTLLLLRAVDCVIVAPRKAVPHITIPQSGSTTMSIYDHSASYPRFLQATVGDSLENATNSPFLHFKWSTVIVDEAHRLTTPFNGFVSTKLRYVLRLDLTADTLRPRQLASYNAPVVMPTNYAYMEEPASMGDVPPPVYTWEALPLTTRAAEQVQRLITSAASETSAGASGLLLRQLRNMLATRRMGAGDPLFTTEMVVRVLPRPTAVALDDLTSKFGSVKLFDSGALNIDEECPVCSDEIEAPVMTNCHHVFCCECLKNWITQQASRYGSTTATRVACPTCRSQCAVTSIVFIKLPTPEETAAAEAAIEEEAAAKKEEVIDLTADEEKEKTEEEAAPPSPPDQHLWGKMEAAKTWIAARLAEGRKTVVISAFESSLQGLKTKLNETDIPVALIAGSVGSKRRATHLIDFETRPDPSVLLISARAAGMGLDLPFAKALLLLEPLNAAMHIQGVGRLLRTGQTAAIPIHILAWGGTPEERMARYVVEESNGAYMDNGGRTDLIRYAGVCGVAAMCGRDPPSLTAPALTQRRRRRGAF